MGMDDSNIIAEFVLESREHLNDIENQFLAIEAGGADIDVDLVNEVFRAVHSIKGASGFLGFSTLGELAHNMENVLNLIRNRELVPDAIITDVLLRAADTLRGMVEDIEDSNEVDILEYVTALQQIVAGTYGGPSADAKCETGTEGSAPDSDGDSAEALPEDSAGGEPDPALTTFPPTNETEAAASTDYGDPTQSVDAVRETVQQLQRSDGDHHETDQQNRRNSTQPDRRAPETSGRRTTDAPKSTPVHAEANIRVQVSVLDSLMNLAGELVLSRNQLLQAVASPNDSGLDSVAARLDQVTSELQEAIMQTRMQAVGTVFNRFPRVVRDLSNQLGKQCELTLEGEDVELDKSVIEAIGDPLTHLVRNAVDHAIESPEDRIKAGKSPVGKIVLRAFHQAGKVNISISDDGDGIDVARIKEKAIARGLITPEQAAEIGDREALRLIFRPGFSMAAKVTDVSGRGVGMDVVKTNVEKLGGAVGIDTASGVGTTIDVRLPLTLAIIPSLIVRCGGDRFAIPQGSISELVRIKAQDVASKIERVKHAEVFRLRGELLPLVRLDTALNLDRKPGEQEEAARNIIVLETGHLQYGLIVDGLHDSEEIVVKPLGRHMQDCHCLAGATILGDGRVALILDVAGIASHTCLALPESDDLHDDRDDLVDSGETAQLMLLFTNAPDEQFGIPMGIIARLERIRSDQIDTVGGQDMLQYRGCSLPLLTLEQHITAAPRPDTHKVHVVVFSASGREVGLVVPELVDIREVSTDVDTVTLAEPGVIGSVLLDGKATRLLDMFALTQVARPAWFADRAPVVLVRDDDNQSGLPRILLAEDSGFFRKQVVGFLEADGYDVTACEDGLVAWNTLRSPGQQFDLIVTDLEMPNMDGFELSQNIKDDPAFRHLPVIALTSLAGEEDIRRGKEVGIDDYQIKLDRDRLLASVASYLQASVANQL